MMMIWFTLTRVLKYIIFIFETVQIDEHFMTDSSQMSKWYGSAQSVHNAILFLTGTATAAMLMYTLRRGYRAGPNCRLLSLL